MQIDSSPRACQVYPAGTPKDQGQYHTCYSLERNIYCWVEKECIFVKTEHIFGKKKKQISKKSEHWILSKVKGKICLLQAKQPEASIYLFMLQFRPIFCVKIIKVFSFWLLKTFVLSVLQNSFVSLEQVNIVTCVEPLI